MSPRQATDPFISLCMIVRDEAENLPVCLDSVRDHVDEIILVDTGSNDNGATRAVGARYGASIYQFDINNHPESFFVDDEVTCKAFGAPGPYSGMVALGDFAAARNESFKHVSPQSEFVLWLDADDSLEQAERLRDVTREMKQMGTALAFLPYDYMRDDKGRVWYRQWRERIFKRGLGAWHQPVHEVYMPTVPGPTLARYEFPKVLHRRKADRQQVPHRNYKNLLRQMKQDMDAGRPVDPRSLFYAGQEARFVDPPRAMGFYQQYLRQSGWPEERAAAHCAIGAMLEFGVLGLPKEEAYEQANREFAVAAAEMPENPDGLLGLARIAYLRGRHPDCIRYTEQAFKLGNYDSMLGGNPMDRIYRPYVYLNHSYSMVGRLDDAIAACKKGLEACPDDPGVPGGAAGMLKHNLAIFEEAKRKQTEMPADIAGPGGKPSLLFDKNEDVDAPPAPVPNDAMVIWAMQLWKQHMAAGNYPAALRFLEALPERVQADHVFAKMHSATMRRGHAETPRDIVFYLGPGVEYWDPTTPNKQGLGGSETAAIEMAKHLRGRGRAVTVYAEAEGIFDGVEYLHHKKFRGTDCKVFIASRAPWAVHAFGPVKADLKFLWVHDIHVGPNEPRLEWALWEYDRILCLSHWHKDYFCQTYPSVDPKRVHVTRNGIDPARFVGEVPKENRTVFSSSPNRGLIPLLDWAPEIRKQVPDFHIDICYGFDTWETMMRNQGNQQQLDEIAEYKRRIDEAVKAGYATFHGRVPQDKLAAMFLRAKVWAYPTNFPETSCISAMEAQAAGALPVTSKYAALAETVVYGELLDPADPDYRQKFVAAVVNACRPTRDEGAMRDWARATLAWKDLANEWLAMFDAEAASQKVNPIHQWVAA